MTQTLEWVQSTSNQSLWSIGRSITHDSLGNAYVAGAFLGEMSMPGVAGSLSVKSNGGYDIFIAKLSGTGKAVWLKSIGSPKDDLKETLTRKPHIAVDKDGAFYLSCTFEDTIDFDPGHGVELHSSISEKDLFLLKLDADGNFLWNKTIGGLGNDEVMGLEITEANDILVFGNYAFDADFDPGPGRKKVIGADDIFILCLDKNGQYVWVKTYGESTNAEQIKDVDLLPNGKMIVSGTFENFIAFDRSNPDSRLFSDGDKDDFLALLDSAAGLLWCQAIKTKDNLSWNSRVVGTEYALYYLTTFHDSLIIGSRYVEAEPEHDFSAVLIRLDLQGNLSNYKLVSSPKGVQLDALAVSPCGSVFIAGETLDTILHLQGAGYGSGPRKVGKNDYLLLHYSSLGHLVNAFSFGDSNHRHHADAGYGLDLGEHGELWVTGRYCGSVDFDPSKDTSALFSYSKARPSMSAFIQKMSLCYKNSTSTLRNYVCRGDSYSFIDGHTLENIQAETSHNYYAYNCKGCLVYFKHTISVHQDQFFRSTSLCVGDSIPGHGVMKDKPVSVVETRTNYYGCKITKTVTYNPSIFDPAVQLVGDAFIPVDQRAGIYHFWKDCNLNQYFAAEPDGTLVPEFETHGYKHFARFEGCYDSSNCVQIDPFADESPKVESEASVYPNPSTGQVRISNNADSYSQVDVIDPRGRVVKHQTMQSSNVVDVNLEDLSNGVYYLQLYSSVTNSASVQKIILDQ